MKIIKGMAVGSALIVLGLTFWFRFERYSRAVFLIDWMLSMIVIGGVRYFYRFFEELFYPLLEKGKSSITFVGDRDTYRALQGFLRIKKRLNCRIRSYIAAENVNLSDLKINEGRAGLLVVEDKYRKMLDQMALDSRENPELCNLSEFLTSYRAERE